MSVESVSLNLLTGLNSIYQSICSHLTPENRESILGSALWKLSGRGTGKTVVALALYSDALRMVLSAIEADGKISEDEMSECEQFFVAVASTFAKVRSEYSEYANLSKMEIRVFLQRYKNDKGVFGYQDESTKWAGVSICQNVKQHCSDGIPLSNFRKLLLSAARALIAADGVSDSEQLFLKKLSAQLKNQLGSESAAEELIVDFLMSPGSGGGADSGSSMPHAMNNQQWAASLFKEKKASSSGERQQRTTVQHSQITPMALYSPLSKQSQYNDDSKKRLSQPEKPQPKVVGPVSCPKCGSTQIFGSKRGFNHQNAAIGTLGDGLAAGLLMGSINSDDVVNNCISCGNSWTPRPERPERAANPNADSELVAGIWAVVGCKRTPEP